MGGGRRRRGGGLHPRPLLDPALPTLLEERGFKGSHAKRIWDHLLRNPEAAGDAPALPSLPRASLPWLAEDFTASTASIRRSVRSPDGTVKLLVALQDGVEVEAVVINHGGEDEFSGCSRMRMRPGATLCLSSQAGCRMGCQFCATGTLGLIRSLEAGEILEQVRLARTVRRDIHKVVFMGMGEPLENHDGVVAAARLLTTERELFGLGARPVTISTVGAVPRGISRLIEAGLPASVRLAVSLHAPTQELREQIVPSARGAPLDRLMAEIDDYGRAAAAVSRRAREERVLVEYCLLAGVNDSEECAHALGRLLQPRRDLVFVNVIPYNPVPGKPYSAPAEDVTWHFVWVLATHYGVRGHARRQLGSSVAAACGQLAKTSLSDDIEDQGAVATARGSPAAAVSLAQTTPADHAWQGGSEGAAVPIGPLVAAMAALLLFSALTTWAARGGCAMARRRQV